MFTVCCVECQECKRRLKNIRPLGLRRNLVGCIQVIMAFYAGWLACILGLPLRGDIASCLVFGFLVAVFIVPAIFWLFSFISRNVIGRNLWAARTEDGSNHLHLQALNMTAPIDMRWFGKSQDGCGFRFGEGLIVKFRLGGWFRGLGEVLGEPNTAWIIMNAWDLALTMDFCDEGLGGVSCIRGGGKDYQALRRVVETVFKNQPLYELWDRSERWEKLIAAIEVAIEQIKRDKETIGRSEHARRCRVYLEKLIEHTYGWQQQRYLEEYGDHYRKLWEVIPKPGEGITVTNEKESLLVGSQEE